MRLTDPARLLLRALGRSAAAAGHIVALSHEGSTPWASATFVGAQHRVAVTGTALDGWLATLDEADLPIPGHIAAGCDVECTPGGAQLTLLVLEA